MLNLGLWCSVFSKHCIVQRDRWYYDSYNSSMTLNPCSQLIQQNLCWNKVCNKILILLELLKVDFLILTCLVPPDSAQLSITNLRVLGCFHKQSLKRRNCFIPSNLHSHAFHFLFLSISCSSLSFRFRNSRSLSFNLSWTEVEESWTNLHHSVQNKFPIHHNSRSLSIIVPIAALKNPSHCTTDMSYETYTIIMHLALSRQTGPFWSLFLSSSSSCFFLSFLEKKSWRRKCYQKRRKSCIQG